MKRKVNCITINTDASFHPKEKRGGYAFSIVCDLFRIKKGGMFKKHPVNSLDAEMMSIANAVYVLLSQRELPETKLIVINCDCKSAFSMIGRNSTNPIGKKISKMLRQLKKLTAPGITTPTKVELRYVKAHTGTQDARSIVNDWCDREAKKWMRISVSKINND